MSNDGQNQDSKLGPKKSWVIFFKPKLLDPKHGGSCGTSKWSHITMICLK